MIFDEESYLAANPDVRESVRGGYIQSGFQHFILYGLKENRLNWPRNARPTILFCTSHNRNFFYKLGDICMAHPTFNAIKEKFPGHNVFWLTREEFGSLTASESDTAMVGCDCRVIDAAPANRLAHDWLHSNRHPIDFIAETSGISIELRHRFIDIPISTGSEKAIDSLNLPESYVVIATGPCYTGGDWSLAERQNVANLFGKQGIRCVSVGGGDSKPLDGTIDLCNKLTFAQAIALIERARLYVGPDTGTSWLACAARTTPKMCVLDRRRLRDGIVGFQGFLLDRNIRDVVMQDGSAHCFEVAWELWNGLKDEFDEEYYLRAHADVADAVRAREFSSGWEHYSRFGKSENRQITPIP